jgi:hypothetical protein
LAGGSFVAGCVVADLDEYEGWVEGRENEEFKRWRKLFCRFRGCKTEDQAKGEIERFLTKVRNAQLVTGCQMLLRLTLATQLVVAMR